MGSHAMDSAWAFASHTNSSGCDAPHKYAWTNTYLGECVHNPKQLVGLILGLTSILSWMFAQAPQLYKNFRTSSAKGLSGYFLANWLCGDITNLVGCILTKQVATQLYTAIWFCFIDVSMVSQYLYYEKFRRQPTQNYVVYSLAPALVVGSLLATTAIAGMAAAQSNADTTELHGPSRVLLTYPSLEGRTNVIGYAIGCFSGVLYLTSRIPQIVKNFRRKSTDGLSLSMFCLAIIGNLTYALGILLESVDADFLIGHLPWLVGSLGTMVFDFTIFFQFARYGSAPPSDEDGEEGQGPSEKDPLVQGRRYKSVLP